MKRVTTREGAPNPMACSECGTKTEVVVIGEATEKSPFPSVALVCAVCTFKVCTLFSVEAWNGTPPPHVLALIEPAARMPRRIVIDEVECSAIEEQIYSGSFVSEMRARFPDYDRLAPGMPKDHVARFSRGMRAFAENAVRVYRAGHGR